MSLARKPPSGDSPSAIDPPYSSARSRTMARPSPEPGAASSARTPRCSTASRIDGSSPGPSSSTVMTTTASIADRGDGHARASPTCTRCRAGCRASRRGLRAGRGTRDRRRHRHVDRDAAIGVQAQQRAREPFGGCRHERSARPASRPMRRHGRAPGDSPPAAACDRPAARSPPRARRGPPRAARSASCASTASGVFRPCARSPALARARATACSRCSSSAFRSLTSGCTSLG